jgi:acetyl-CoA acetyltransferase
MSRQRVHRAASLRTRTTAEWSEDFAAHGIPLRRHARALSGAPAVNTENACASGSTATQLA